MLLYLLIVTFLPIPSIQGDIYGQDDFKWLHLHGKNGQGPYSSVSKTFDVPKYADLVRFEFLFYEIGEWERQGKWQDEVHIKIGDTLIDLKTFDDSNNELDGVLYPVFCFLGICKQKNLEHLTIDFLPNFYPFNRILA